MRRNALYSIISIAAVACCSLGCAHATLIESTPPGAEVYVNGVQVGVTPYTLTDTVGGGERYEIVLRKPGFRIHQETLQQDQFNWPRGIASVACGACTLGLGCFGLMWSWQLQDRYAFTLEPMAADAAPDSNPAAAPPEVEAGKETDAPEPVIPL